jgi:hypothetical protein
MLEEVVCFRCWGYRNNTVMTLLFFFLSVCMERGVTGVGALDFFLFASVVFFSLTTIPLFLSRYFFYITLRKDTGFWGAGSERPNTPPRGAGSLVFFCINQSHLGNGKERETWQVSVYYYRRLLARQGKGGVGDLIMMTDWRHVCSTQSHGAYYYYSLGVHGTWIAKKEE